MTRNLKKLAKRLVFLGLMAATLLFGIYNSSDSTHTSVSEINYSEKEQNDVFILLNQLDYIIKKKSSENKIYGNIYNQKARQQVLSYMNAIIQFSKARQVRTICEIGFAGGHSALVFLYITTNAQYVGFDEWNRMEYEEDAIKWLKKSFNNREIRIIKGDSTKTVPQFNETCDLIHINGAHHAHYPLTDMKNMYRLASKYNLLLIDDCSNSWPAVLEGVRYLQDNDLVNFIDVTEDRNWVFRGSNKGWCIGSYNVSHNNYFLEQNSYKRINKFTFLGKQFCSPFWTGKECNVAANKHCSLLSDDCFYNDEYGTLSVSCKRWKDAQREEKDTWDIRQTDTDRNEAHAKSFDNYNSLPYELGDVIELGAGPFTQSATILRNRTTKSVTIIEPIATHYIRKVKKCFYQSGSINNLPTTVISLPADELNIKRKFDTLIMINVIEHVYDGLSIFRSALNLIKDNGLLIWHERIWDEYTGKAKSSNDREFKLHPIRMKTVIAKLIMASFETLYVAWDTEELRRLKNHGVYFIGRKTGHIGKTLLPKHLKCFDSSKGFQDFIFFVGKTNYSYIVNQINITKNYVNLRYIFLVLTEEVSSTALSDLLKYKQIKVILSHHHLKQWNSEIGYLTTQCKFFISQLTADINDNLNTICVGRETFKKVSIVLMGRSLRRLKNYDLILPAYTKMRSVNSIIIVWNNKKETFRSHNISSKLIMVYPEVNSMNNRFNVSHLIKTDAVLIIDDDVLMNEPLLEHMLFRWNDNTDRLLGVSPDMRYVNSKQEYSTKGSDAVIAIGKTMLFHRKYLNLYMSDKTLVNYNHNKFCEDISMNAVIRNATKLKPLFITQNDNRRRQNLPETDGLSIIRTKWQSERTECVRYVSRHYNLTL